MWSPLGSAKCLQKRDMGKASSLWEELRRHPPPYNEPPDPTRALKGTPSAPSLSTNTPQQQQKDLVPQSRSRNG